MVFPDLHRGTGCLLMLATDHYGAVEAVFAASVKGHIWALSDSGKCFLHFCFKKLLSV